VNASPFGGAFAFCALEIQRAARARVRRSAVVSARRSRSARGFPHAAERGAHRYPRGRRSKSARALRLCFAFPFPRRSPITNVATCRRARSPWLPQFDAEGFAAP